MSGTLRRIQGALALVLTGARPGWRWREALSFGKAPQAEDDLLSRAI